MSAEYTDIPPELMGKADPDQQWIEAQLNRIDPWRGEQGHDGADTAALRKLVLELRQQLTTPQPPQPEDGGPAFPSVYGTMDNGDGFTQNQGETGITVRDYFAAKASEEDINEHIWKGFKEEYVYDKYDGTKEIRMRQAMWTREEARYRYADAMLKARAA